MESKLTFEVGKVYRTRDGEKVQIILIRPTYMVGEISYTPILWDPNGSYLGTLTPTGVDLVAEWQEPARVQVFVYRHRADGRLFACERSTAMDERYWELRAKREIVEGEGL